MADHLSDPDGADGSAAALVCNGIDALTGDYSEPPLRRADIQRIALRLAPDPGRVRRAEKWRQMLFEETYGTRHGIEPKDLATAGWGVIFARDADPAVREALADLLVHRRSQAARVKEHYYRELSGDDGYRPGESDEDFLVRHRAAPGVPADPALLPYYLLLVGGPDEIPYDFQTQLDVEYAVGRLSLATPDEYARYARQVVEAETRRPERRPQAVLFGVKNPHDRETFYMCEYLVKRAAAYLRETVPGWTIEGTLENQATKARLECLLGGSATPDLLFTACHGMNFPSGDPHQLSRQGALLCQDWPGPGSGPVVPDYYFSAEDLAGDARANGLISFHYACHSAGTPRFDTFSAHRLGGLPKVRAPRSFVARLPQRLLAAGALAVVGHVDRAWLYSFIWKGAGGQSQVFEDSLRRLLEGHPVGSALEPFGIRYASLSRKLLKEMELARVGMSIDEKLARLWTATNDARNYVILGDPAVRLPAVGAAAARAQPA